MARPRQYESPAAKQAAWRAKQKEIAGRARGGRL